MSNTKSNRKKKANESAPCSVAIPRELQAALIARAEVEDRSFSAVIRRAIAAYVGQG